MMEEQLAYYLIDEGYAVDESSAYKILDVISESFYEYLLSEALTPKQRAAGRARTARMRQETGIEEPDVGTSAEIRANIRSRKPTTRTGGGLRQTTEKPGGTLRVQGGGYLPPTETRPETNAEKRSNISSNTIISKDGQVKPVTFVNSSGQRVEINATGHSGSSLTLAPPKKGQRAVQQPAQDPHGDVGVGGALGGVDVYSRQRTGTSGTGRTGRKKPQPEPQPPTQPTSTPAGRERKVRQLPSQAQPQPQRATTPPERTNPTQSWRQVNRPNPTTGTRGNPNRPNRMMSLIPKNSQ
jgi:hypothetical protein